jgi:hypothetical protein
MDRQHPDASGVSPVLPATAAAQTNEVAKNFPWVPVLYEQTYPVHLERVRQLLAAKPVTAGIFLNDVQDAPSACAHQNLSDFTFPGV